MAPFSFMQIRILGNVLVGGVWHEPGIGNYSPELAQHLISIGVAEPFETKVSAPVEVKAEKKPFPEKPSSVSRPAQASRKKTAKGSGKAG